MTAWCSIPTACLSRSQDEARHTPYGRVFRRGRYTLCISTEILEEYEEVIARMTRPEIARNVIDLILKRSDVMRIDPHFHMGLITADPDDNKFVDCAFAANATYIVSNDSHYDVLRDLPFPQILVLKLQAFIERLKQM